MDIPHLLLLALFVLTIGHLITLKLCSGSIDHRTAPLFISGWTLLGAIAASPFYGALWSDSMEKFSAKPLMLLVSVARGGLLYLLLVISQKLMQVSLSSRHYVTPLAVGLMVGLNSLTGEKLVPHELVCALGLCLLAAGFFFRGHMSQLSTPECIAYAQLVVLSAVISSFDRIVIRDINWYGPLIVSNITLLGLSLALHYRDVPLLKTALLHRYAIAAGVLYAATELVKFYQQVTINPVTVVNAAQAGTKPVILLLSALIWKERTPSEQLLWGLGAFVLIAPLFLPAPAAFIDALFQIMR